MTEEPAAEPLSTSGGTASFDSSMSAGTTGSSRLALCTMLLLWTGLAFVVSRGPARAQAIETLERGAARSTRGESTSPTVGGQDSGAEVPPLCLPLRRYPACRTGLVFYRRWLSDEVTAVLSAGPLRLQEGSPLGRGYGDQEWSHGMTVGTAVLYREGFGAQARLDVPSSPRGESNVAASPGGRLGSWPVAVASLAGLAVYNIRALVATGTGT